MSEGCNLGQTVADASAKVAETLNQLNEAVQSNVGGDVSDTTEVATDTSAQETETPVTEEAASGESLECGNQPQVCDEGDKCCQNEKNN